MRLFCLLAVPLALACSLDRAALGGSLDGGPSDGGPPIAPMMDGSAPVDVGPMPGTDAAPIDAPVSVDGGATDAGPPPPPDPTACDDVLAGAIFCDGFEAADLSRWTQEVEEGSGSTAPTTTRTYRGSRALRARVGDGGSVAYVQYDGLGALDSGDLYFRAYYYFPSAEAVEDVAFALFGESASPWWHASISAFSGDQFALWVQEPSVFIGAPSVRLPRDRWFCVQAHIGIDDSSGSYSFSVDGAVAATRSDIDTRLSRGYEQLLVGIAYIGPGQGALELFVDEVAIDTSPLPCDP